MKTPFRKQSKTLEFISVISQVASVFASAQTKNSNATINSTLKIIGEYVNADRSYIFKYDFDNDTTSNTHEYCAKSITKEIDNLQDIPLSMVTEWVETHKANNPMNIPDVSKLPKDDGVRLIIEPQGIKSLVTIPLFRNNKLFGFLGFDSVKTIHNYTDCELNLLNKYSEILIRVFERFDLDSKLQNEKMKIELLVKAAYIGSWEWNLKTDKMIINDIWANMLGYELIELEPIDIDTWKNHTHPDDLILAMKNIQDVLQKKSSYYSSDIRMKHKNGEYIWIKDSGQVTEWDGDTPLRMNGAHIDISEHKKKEQELSVITQAVNFSPNSIMITDSMRNIIYVNPMFEKLTGYTSKEVIGKTASSIRLNLENEHKFEQIKAAIYNKEVWNGEFYNRKKNGSYYWEFISLSAVFDEFNNVSHHISISKEITARKNIEITLEKKRKNLEDDIKMKITEIEDSQQAAIIALAKITESRDKDTGKHVERVQYLSKALATSLSEHDRYKGIIDTQFINDIFYASALHDIGKVNISDNILLKPGKLNTEEMEIMKTHVLIGDSILADMIKYYPKSNLILMGRKIARFHHEKWDGSGYLGHLKGRDIPLSARIMALVDVYDAVRSKRPYKDIFSHKETFDIIINGSGKHFDPDIVDAFVRTNEQFDAIFSSLKN